MTRAELHEILDALPETELPAAEEALRSLGSAAVHQALDQAPLDDEPDDDDLDGQLTEAAVMPPRGAVSLPTSSAGACGCRDAPRPLDAPGREGSPSPRDLAPGTLDSILKQAGLE